MAARQPFSCAQRAWHDINIRFSPTPSSRRAGEGVPIPLEPAQNFSRLSTSPKGGTEDGIDRRRASVPQPLTDNTACPASLPAFYQPGAVARRTNGREGCLTCLCVAPPPLSPRRPRSITRARGRAGQELHNKMRSRVELTRRRRRRSHKALQTFLLFYPLQFQCWEMENCTRVCNGKGREAIGVGGRTAMRCVAEMDVSKWPFCRHKKLAR